MRSIPIMAVLMLLFAGCLQKSFCQELQPDVAAYFGNDVAARMSSMDENSPQMQWYKSFAPAGTNSISMPMDGQCAFSSGKNAVQVMYGTSASLEGKTPAQRYAEHYASARNQSNGSFANKAVATDEYFYTYSGMSAMGMQIHMLQMIEGPRSIMVVASRLQEGTDYPEETIRDFALEVGRKMENRQ